MESREVVVEIEEQKIPLRITGAVHYDAQNLPLVQSLVRCVPNGADAVLDVGAGTGLLGLVAAKVRGVRKVVFTDIGEEEVKVCQVNAFKLQALGGLQSFQVLRGDMLESVSPDDLFDAILFNPPQTGGPPAFELKRKDKFGGEDGSKFYVQLAESCSGLLKPGGTVLYLMIGLSNRARVQQAFLDQGFSVRLVDQQLRQFSKKQLDAICEGLFEHQLALQKAGSAQFQRISERDGGTFEYQQCLFEACKPL